MTGRRYLEIALFLGAFVFMSYYAYGAYIELQRDPAKESHIKTAEKVNTLRASADRGNAAAQYEIASYYYYGSAGFPMDKTKSMDWFMKAAEQGHIRAQLQIAYEYKEGGVLEKDLQKSIQYYTMAAEQDDPDAITRLAWIYFENEQLPNHYLKAAVMFKESAEHGDAKSQAALGWLYANGKGFPRDDIKALEWMELAYKNGHTDHASTLANMYLDGQGTGKDLVKAGALYKEAMKSNDGTVTGFIGKLGDICQNAYLSHLAPRVLESCILAAEAGDLDSQLLSADLAKNGHLGEQPQAKSATAYYIMAAKQGHLVSQIHLAREYSRKGSETGMNLPEAYMWLKVIDAQNHTPEINLVSEAKKDLAFIAAQLSPEQRSKAEINASLYTVEIEQGKKRP